MRHLIKTFREYRRQVSGLEFKQGYKHEKRHRLRVFARAISGCFVFTDVLAVVEEDRGWITAGYLNERRRQTSLNV